MKIIFLSILAATALSTLSSSLVFNSSVNKELSVVENADYLNENTKKIITNGDGEFWGSREDLFENYTGGWQCWESAYLYCNPSNLIYKPNSNYYQLSSRIYICPEDWDKPTVTYIGTANYTGADWFFDLVSFDQEESAFDVVFRTHNANAEGELYIYYTYFHFEEDPHLQQEEVWPEPVDYDGIVREGKSWNNGTPTNEYVDVGFKDNKPSKATKVEADFHVDAQIHNYNWWDNIINGYSRNAIDCDWYRFQINQSVHYNIYFDAPNHGYTITIYKYRNHDLEESSMLRRYSTSMFVNAGITLTAGTYYVKVTVSSTKMIETNKNYHITFTGSRTNYEFPIYSQNLKKFKGVIWENEYIPDNISDRWSTNVHELRSQIISTQVPSNKKGYFDPIFYSKEEDLSMNKNILDSVIYVWGAKQLEVLAGTLQQLQVALEDLTLQDFRKYQIWSDILGITSGTLSLAIKGVTKGTASNIGDSVKDIFKGDIISPLTDSTPIGVDEDMATICEGICDLILGSVPENIDYFTTEENALSLLIGDAEGLIKDPKGVVAIPVYAETDRIAIEQEDDNIREAWVYKRTFVPYGKLYNAGTTLLITYPTNKFKFDSITEFQELGKKVKKTYQVQKTFHGRLIPFSDAEEMKGHIHYDEIFDPTNLRNL